MKIYVVTSGCYSDYHIERVYTDKAAAEAYCNTMDLYNLYDDEDSPRIEVYETSEAEKFETKWVKICGEFNNKGELVNKYRLNEEEEYQIPKLETTEYGDEITICIKPRQDEKAKDFRERVNKILIDTYYFFVDKLFKERRKQWKS